MHVFRISRAEYINDLTGVGARTYGGRWNRKGTSMVYTAESRALATVEYLVHVPFSITPHDLAISCIEISDKVKPLELQLSELPGNWRDYPPPDKLAELGTAWVKSKSSLLLRVPSAVVDEYNILINPLHPDFKHLKIKETKQYFFDNRLLKNQG